MYIIYKTSLKWGPVYACFIPVLMHTFCHKLLTTYCIPGRHASFLVLLNRPCPSHEKLALLLFCILKQQHFLYYMVSINMQCMSYCLKKFHRYIVPLLYFRVEENEILYSSASCMAPHFPLIELPISVCIFFSTCPDRKNIWYTDFN